MLDAGLMVLTGTSRKGADGGGAMSGEPIHRAAAINRPANVCAEIWKRMA
jgi:hypothetical protein